MKLVSPWPLLHLPLEGAATGRIRAVRELNHSNALVAHRTLDGVQIDAIISISTIRSSPSIRANDKK